MERDRISNTLQSGEKVVYVENEEQQGEVAIT